MSIKLKILLLVTPFSLWLAFDQIVKMLFSCYAQGTVVTTILFGLIDFRIVHNTGAAWGILAGNPVLLGVVSVIVCIMLLAYFVWDIRAVSPLQIVGISLILAGGIGNAIDRFAQGYVLDFISTNFITFPVFNIADIGVTCGLVLLFAGMIASQPLLGSSSSDKESDL